MSKLPPWKNHSLKKKCKEQDFLLVLSRKNVCLLIGLDFSTKNHRVQSTSAAHLWQSRKPREEAAHLVGHARHHVLMSGGQDQADLQRYIHLAEPSVVVVEVVEQLV